MPTNKGLVVVGGSYAGLQIAASARENGYSEPILLLSEEADLPYQRPPLSKGFLLGKVEEAALPLRNERFYRDHAIEVLLETRVCALDRAGKSVRSQSGHRFAYDQLALAVGTRPRLLSVPGAELKGVLSLRSVFDARTLRAQLADIETAVIIGGGYIGLEVAAVLAAQGKRVTVIEAQNRLLARAATPVLSDYVAALHRAKGVTIITDAIVLALGGANGRVQSVTCDDGSVIPADLVIAAIGIAPNLELAQDAGLTCSNGIVVDRFARTTDPDIVAAGDCTSHPSLFAGGMLRLESVQNATDQAKTAGLSIADVPTPYEAIPWFWSDQYEAKFQTVGLPHGSDAYVIRGALEENQFSIFHFRDGALMAIESVNRAADQLIGRKLLTAGTPILPEQAADPKISLASLLAAK